MGVFRLRRDGAARRAGENAGGPDTAGRNAAMGHGALYDALNPWPDRRRAAAADSASLRRPGRPDAPCSADRLFCHPYDRSRDQHLMIPAGRTHFVAALESGRTSWCQLLDAVRLGPADDVASHRRPGPPCGGGSDRGRAVARGRRGHPRRLRRRLRGSSPDQKLVISEQLRTSR